MKRLSLQALKYISITIVALYFLLWIFSPQISRPLLKKELVPYGLELNEKMHLRFNPFISQIHIQNFQLTNKKTKVFSVQELKLKVNLFDLLFKQLYVDIFMLDEVYIRVDVQGGNIEVAGLKIPEKSTKEISAPDRSAPLNVEVVLPQLEITNGELDITLDGKALPIKIANLMLENVTATKTEQYAEVTLNSEFLKTNLSLNTQASINPTTNEFSSSLKLESKDLAGFSTWLPNMIKQLSGEASLSGDSHVVIRNGNIDLVLSDTELVSNNISISHKNVRLDIARQELMLSQLQLTKDNNQQLNLVGNGNFSVETITILNQKSPEKIVASIARVDGNKFDIINRGGAPSFTLPKLEMVDALFSYNTENDIPALSQFKRLKLDDIKLSETTSHIENVELSGLVVDAQLDPTKQLINMDSIASVNAGTPTDDTSAMTEASSNSESKLAFRLGHFTLTDEASIHFNDLSVEPTYQRDFTISELTMSTIDTQQPELETKLTITSKSNEYANLTIEGSLQPFLETPKYTAKGLVKEVSLPAVSSYIKDILKHEIKSGQLDVDIDANIEGTTLSGNTEIVIRGLDFTASDDFEVNSIKDQTAIPFSVALGMLKDGNGNVNLDIPLSGDTNEPSFGTSGFLSLIIKQATMAAAKDYLLTTFVPYANVISLAMTAGEHLLKVRFNDLNYLPKQTTIGAEQEKFAQEFSSLLTDKPDTQVTICPVATAADVGLEAGTNIVEASEINMLTQISEQRFHGFKKYVVNQYSIESSRLLMCSPQIDSDADAKPRLTFGT